MSLCASSMDIHAHVGTSLKVCWSPVSKLRVIDNTSFPSGWFNFFNCMYLRVWYKVPCPFTSYTISPALNILKYRNKMLSGELVADLWLKVVCLGFLTKKVIILVIYHKSRWKKQNVRSHESTTNPNKRKSTHDQSYLEQRRTKKLKKF